MRCTYKIVLSYALIAVLVFAISFQPIESWQQQTDTGWQKYSNIYTGVQLEYPSEWHSNSEFLDFMYDAAFFSEFKGEDDVFDERVVLVVEKLPPGTSLGTFSTAMFEELKASENQFDPIIDNDEAVLAGHEARSLVYSSYAPDYEVYLTTKAIWTVVGGRGFTIIAHAYSAEYEEHEVTFNRIIDSFEITKLNPDGPTTSYTLYSGNSDLFTVDYPYTWTTAFDSEELPRPESLVLFSSPWHGYMFDRASILIDNFKDFEIGMSRSEYSEKVIREISDNTEAFELVESKDVEISGFAGHEISYLWRQDGVEVRTIQAWVPIGSSAFHITGSAENAIFDDYEDIINHIIESFKPRNVGSSSISNEEPAPKAIDYAEYKSSDYGIRILYPLNWVEFEPENLAVGFASPAVSDQDEFFEKFVIGASDSPVRIEIEQLNKAYMSSIQSALDGYVLVESQDSTLDGHPAHYISATGNSEGQKVRLYAIWTVVENRQYFLMFMSELESYSKHSTMLRTMISSFEIDETKLETGYRVYENKGMGMTIQYPGSWQVEERSAYGEPPRVTFANKDRYQFLTLTAFGMVWNSTLDAQAKLLPEMLSGGDESFRLVESTRTTLAGFPAYKIVFTRYLDATDTPSAGVQPVAFSRVADSVEIKTAVYMTIKNGIVYNVIFDTTTTDYLASVNMMNKIVESVKINPDAMTKEVSGRVADPSSSLIFDVPAGWTAYKSNFGNATSIRLFSSHSNSSDEELDGAAIAVSIHDIDFAIKKADEMVLSKSISCAMPAHSRIVQATATLSMQIIEQDCDVLGIEAKTTIYSMYTNDDLITISLTADDEESFLAAKPAFEAMVRSVELEKSINAFRSSDYDKIFGVSSFNQTVASSRSSHVVKISTRSNITDFEFDEAKMSISFKVTGKTGTAGHSSIVMSGILAGPYVVTIDGSPTDDYVIGFDEITNETAVTVSYPHSTHTITITGTTVVPEFSSAVMIGLLVVTGMIASLLYSRYRASKYESGMPLR